MKRFMPASAVITAGLALALGGCGGGGTSGEPDGGRPDTPPTDTEPEVEVEVDAGPDAEVEVDAGPEVDADAGEVDAGCPSEPCRSCEQASDCEGLYEDLAPCEAAACEDGWCTRTVTDDASACDDGNPCTEGSCAEDGTCTQELTGASGCCTEDADCQDDNPCTTGTCGDDGTCEFEAASGSCDDGDPCTTNDTCQAGECVGSSDGSCYQACTLDGEAGDTVTCTVELARLGESTPPPVEMSFELDYPAGSVTLLEFVDPFCIEGSCGTNRIPQGATSLQPSGHEVYLTPSSPDTWSGSVTVELTHVGAPDTPITEAWVTPAGETTGDPTVMKLRFELNAPVSGSPVLLENLATSAASETGLTSTLVDRASDDAAGGVGRIVSSNDPCGDQVCYDGNPCTEDTCEEGSCSFEVSEGAACDDGNPCTIDDTCQADGVCEPQGFAEEGTTCTGANACTQVGTCDGAGACEIDPEMAVECDASDDPCLDATCDPATGECSTEPLPGESCDDGDACTTGDTCQSDGTCSGEARSCDDGIGCTIDSCDPDEGCVHEPDDAACDDGNPCTEDSCVPSEGGCVFETVSTSCDDGDPCTVNDTCTNGVCQGEPDPDCSCESDDDCDVLDDGNPCTGSYTCEEGSCVIDPDTVVECPADGKECKVDWSCDPETGQCEPGGDLDCSDGDACTEDSCHPNKGCQHELIPGCADAFICEISGSEGEVVNCPIRMARANADDPIPTGGELKLQWNAERVALDNLQHEVCAGGQCFQVDLVSCDGNDGTNCSTDKLQPSGHDVVLTPEDIAEWQDWLSVLLFHGGNADASLSEAVVQGDGISGDPLLLTARFELQSEVSSGDPVQINVSDYKFNPASGLPTNVSVESVGGVRTFVVTPE